MEQYEFEKEQNTPTIKYGYFEQKVFDKHVQAYGTDGAQKNLTTATKILFQSSLKVDYLKTMYFS